MQDDESQRVRRSWWSYLPRARSVFLACSIAGLLITNVATLVSARAHDWLHSLLWQTLTVAGETSAERLMRNSPHAQIEAKVKARTAALDAQNVELSERNLRLAQQLNVNATAAKNAASRVYHRLEKGVVRNTVALPAESVPYVGVGVTLAVTTLDIYDACATMKDINSLLRMMGQGEEKDDLCGRELGLPTKGQLLSSIKTDWQKSAEYVRDEVKNTNVPMPHVRWPTKTELSSVICPVVPLQPLCSWN